MANFEEQTATLREKLTDAGNVIILLPSKANIDSIAAGLALFLSLKSAQKEPVIITEDTLKVLHTTIFGIGEIKKSLPDLKRGNFVITLADVVLPDGTIPTLNGLDYYPEGSNLNLVFQTQKGAIFNPTNLTTRYESTGSDILFVMGASKVEELGFVYSKNLDRLSKMFMVNIDSHADNTNFGTINIVESGAPLSELTMSLIDQLGLPKDEDIATNVITGIYAATENLSKNVIPSTFVTVGEAMKVGGKIPQQPTVANPIPVINTLQGTLPIEETPITEPQIVEAPTPTPEPVVTAKPEEVETPKESVIEEAAPVAAAETEEANTSTKGPAFDFSILFKKPEENKTESQDEVIETSQSREETPSGEFAASSSIEGERPTPDWLTPKVFKGKSLG